MNVDTGELRKLTSLIEENHAAATSCEKERDLRKQQEAMKSMGFTPIPKELNQAAEKKLAGKDSAMVSLTSGGKLSRWAAAERKKKRKMVAESRRKNRSK
jgi:hypothetical protein